jgi:hypothetical protein
LRGRRAKRLTGRRSKRPAATSQEVVAADKAAGACPSCREALTAERSKCVPIGRSKAERSVGRCGAMAAPSGSSSPVSSKITTPLQSRLQPCSGWLTTVCAASRSGADGAGQGGECGHISVPPGSFISHIHVDSSVPRLMGTLPWLMLTVFPLAICSFPLVSAWHRLTTFRNYLFSAAVLRKIGLDQLCSLSVYAASDTLNCGQSFATQMQPPKPSSCG